MKDGDNSRIGFHSGETSIAGHIFQYARTFYLWTFPQSYLFGSYLSQFESVRMLIIFGTATASEKPSWAQQLGMQFGSEGDQILRSLEGRCSSCKQCNAH